MGLFYKNGVWSYWNEKRKICGIVYTIQAFLYVLDEDI